MDPEKRPILLPEGVEFPPPRSKRASKTKFLSWLAILSVAFLVFISSFLGRHKAPSSCWHFAFDCSGQDADITNDAKYYYDHSIADITASSSSVVVSVSARSQPQQPTTATTASSAAAPERTVLRNFQIDSPVLMPYGPADSDGTTSRPESGGSGGQGNCSTVEVLLMRRDFAWSYGDPFVGEFHFYYMTDSLRKLKGCD